MAYFESFHTLDIHVIVLNHWKHCLIEPIHVFEQPNRTYKKRNLQFYCLLVQLVNELEKVST